MSRVYDESPLKAESSTEGVRGLLCSVMFVLWPLRNINYITYFNYIHYICYINYIVGYVELLTVELVE